MPNWFEDFGDSRKYYGSSLTRVPNPPKGPGIIRKLSDIFFTVKSHKPFIMISSLIMAPLAFIWDLYQVSCLGQISFHGIQILN